uniref:O-fucosyltransferase family protein n=1 Tax=Ananas comosus var. bracteatus TaxID=296719 RepID=A0A6V7Q8J3_ANACO|nr:unnamed protein product [Ananas comosus var. bracteatus]
MDPKALTRHLRRVEPLSAIVVVLLLLLVLVLAALLLFLFSPNSITSIHITSVEEREKPIAIWKAPRQVEWRPASGGKILDIKGFEGNVCIFTSWQDYLCNSSLAAALPIKNNGYIRIDCYGGLNQMKHDLCGGIGIARLLNATMVLPIAAYWNESRCFDVDYFIEKMKGFVAIVKGYQKKLHQKSHLK